MKALSKQQQADMDKIADRCSDAATDLETAIEAYNAAMAEHRERVQQALNKYHDELSSMREFVEELHSDAVDYHGERSERWQEGEAGQQYQQWMDSMQGISEIDALDFDLPEPLEVPDGLPDWSDRSFLPANSPDEM